MDRFASSNVQVCQSTMDRAVALYKDENTRPEQATYRSYYGDNVPALANMSNGQNYIYQENHSWTRHAATIKHIALLGGNHRLAGMMGEYVRQERVSLEERVTGFYGWTPLQNINNVWKWVGANGYYLRWSNNQRTEFQGMLKLMSSELHRGQDASAEKSATRQDVLSRMCQCTLKSLHIDNIEVVAVGHAQYRFYPVGYSKPQHRRSDFSTQDQWRIDIFYPDYWVEGDRPGREEEPVNGDGSAATGEEHSSWEGRDEWNHPDSEENSEDSGETRDEEDRLFWGVAHDSADADARRTLESMLGSLLEDN